MVHVKLPKEQNPWFGQHVHMYVARSCSKAVTKNMVKKNWSYTLSQKLQGYDIDCDTHVRRRSLYNTGTHCHDNTSVLATNALSHTHTHTRTHTHTHPYWLSLVAFVVITVTSLPVFSYKNSGRRVIYYIKCTAILVLLPYQDTTHAVMQS